MPYKIVQVQDNPRLYKVKKDVADEIKYYSKKPLTYKMALKQLKALYANTNEKRYKLKN